MDLEYTDESIRNLMELTSREIQRDTDRKMLLAKKISKAMRAKGWKQQDLANALGKKQPEISKWLSGTHNFTDKTLWALEDVLGNVKLISLDESDRPRRYVAVNMSQIIESPDEVVPGNELFKELRLATLISSKIIHADADY